MTPNQRGDRLLRALVDGLATAGYRPIARHSVAAECAVMLHSPSATPGAVRIIHRPRQHCVHVLCLASGHALHGYYNARRPKSSTGWSPSTNIPVPHRAAAALGIIPGAMRHEG